MLLGIKVFLHMNRIKEKHSTKLVMCLLHRMWGKGRCFCWMNRHILKKFFLFSKPFLKTRDFFGEIWYSGARSSIYRNVGQFLADYIASQNTIRQVILQWIYIRYWEVWNSNFVYKHDWYTEDTDDIVPVFDPPDTLNHQISVHT